MNRKRASIACKFTSLIGPVTPVAGLCSHSPPFTCTLSSWVLSLNSKCVVEACSLVQLKSGFYGQEESPTAAESEASSLQRRGMWQTTYEFHYTHVTEQNAFMQKYLLNTSSVPDTSRFWGDNSEQKRLFVSVSLHSVEGENNKQIPNKHQMYHMVISVVNSGSGVLVNV